MNDRVNQPYKTQGSRVYGQGQSYNTTNNITAQQLCNTLNKYHTTKEIINHTTNQYDKITRQLIQITMTLKILEEEINKLTELVKK